MIGLLTISMNVDSFRLVLGELCLLHELNGDDVVGPLVTWQRLSTVWTGADPAVTVALGRVEGAD